MTTQTATPTLSSIEFRPFQPTDLYQVKLLNKTAFRASDLFEKIVFDDHDLEDPTVYEWGNRGVLLLGFVGDELVTMGGLCRQNDEEGEIRRMRTKLELQGHGLGRHVLGLLEESARELGYKAIVLDTTADQPNARKMYEAGGYRETHRQKKENWVLESIYYRKELVD